tara:strand:+ start:26983 stop:27108 length:126 start_codon:yes stop_codon:yes gene_type:complete
MITGLIIGVVIGAVGFYLVLRNNPNLAKKIAGIVDKIDDNI